MILVWTAAANYATPHTLLHLRLYELRFLSTSVVPHSRTLCPASPSLQWVLCASVPHLHSTSALCALTVGTMIRCDCQSPFSELFFPFFSDTLQAPSLVCVPSLSARWTGWKRLPSFARALVFRQYPSSSDVHFKEVIGSPKFPSYPRRYMPRSKTPVVSCTLTLSYPGLLPSTACKASAFPRSREFIH